MPGWLQFLIVVVSIGLFAIALFALTTLRRLVDKVTADLSQLTQTVRESASRIDRVADEASHLLNEARGIVTPIQRVSQRVEGLSSSLFGEVEAPLQTATALMHGVRIGTGFLMKRLMNRITHRQSPNHRGENHE
jgi:uncharacterized protein YoxC